MGDVKLILFKGKSVSVVELDTLNDALDRLRGYRGAMGFAVVRGEVLMAGIKEEALGLGEDGGERVAVVLDQMFRGFSDVLVRELSYIDVHEVVGRGVDEPVRAGDHVYWHPAKDDFDVLKLLESISGRYSHVIFFTGDKKLAEQSKASVSGLGNVTVIYMPPSEYPGKESIIRAMIKEVARVKS